MKNTHYRDYLVHTAPTFLHGILTGSAVGVLIFFFRLAAEELTALSREIYRAARGNLLHIFLLTGREGNQHQQRHQQRKNLFHTA